MESAFTYSIVVVVGVLIPLSIYAIRSVYTKDKKIRDALFQLGFGYKRHDPDGSSRTPQEIEFKNAKKELVFKKFNYGFSTLDFYKKQQALEELFGAEIVDFERVSPFKVIGKKADFKSPLIKEVKERADVLIGFDGVQKHYFGENRSGFVFAPSGTGKTHFLKNCIIKQLEKMDADIHIITSKKSDFNKAYSYHNIQDLEDFKKILKSTEAERLDWEEMGFRNKKHIVFIFDEVQEVNDDKEITSVIKSWVRVT